MYLILLKFIIVELLEQLMMELCNMCTLFRDPVKTIKTRTFQYISLVRQLYFVTYKYYFLPKLVLSKDNSCTITV